MKEFLANRQCQSLAAHCVLVGRLAQQIIYQGYGSSAYGQGEGLAKVEQLKTVALVAGLLHDTGKVDQEFQTYISTLQPQSLAAAPLPISENVEDGEHIDALFKDKRFSFNDYPRHEEVSWLLLRRFLVKSQVQTLALGGDTSSGSVHHTRFAMLEHAIYWHHAKPLRDKDAQDKKFGNAEQLVSRMNDKSAWLAQNAHADLKDLLNQIDTIQGSKLVTYLCSDADEASAEEFKTPAFKAIYEDEAWLTGSNKLEPGLAVEMTRTAIRSAVVSADRIVSRLTAAELEEHLSLNTLPAYRLEIPGLRILYRQIELMAESFAAQYPGTRTNGQVKVAKDLAGISLTSAIACLQGPAGCGKTKIALQYLSQLNQQKRVFIFVPRTAIGETLFHELVNTYAVTEGVEFLSGGKKLFSTGQGEVSDTPDARQGTGNLVITTIDQLCKTMLSHQKIDLLTQLADSHVIFDEFHELVELPGIALLFMELMRLRQFTSTGTLLVSATPNPHLLRLLKLEPRAVVRVDTFNNQPLTIRLAQWSPGVYANGPKAEPHPFATDAITPEPGAFVICNTATVAQQASVVHRIKGRAVICFHSKFTPKDKSALLNRILRVFGTKSVVADEVLIAGPIVQASLNITTRHMHTEMCHAENALQRIGRINRFGTMDSATVTVYYATGAVDQKTGLVNLANNSALVAMHQKARTNAFYRFLAARVAQSSAGTGECVVNLHQLYGWYDEFHKTPGAALAYQADFESIVTASAKVFAKNDFDPVQYPAFVKKAADGRLSKNSLRGRSYYILPLSLRLSAPGSKADVGLLWNHLSDASQVLTDELRSSVFDDDISDKYRTWTKGATKPSVMSPTTAGKGIDLLKAMTKATKSFKTWPQVKGKAVMRDTPILVACGKYDDDNLYYFEFAGMKVGLVKASTLEKVSALQIKAAVQ